MASVSLVSGHQLTPMNSVLTFTVTIHTAGRSGTEKNILPGGDTMNAPTLVIEKADTIWLRNEQGESIRLSSLWAEGVAALVFVRHFG